MKKNSLLIIIDSLKSGGAEILLAGILPGLTRHYSVIFVTLTSENDFEATTALCEKKYELGYTGPLSIPISTLKLRKIIRRHRPVLVHAHLFYSSLIARMACPASIPLLYSLHSQMSKDVFNGHPLLTLLEKKTIRKNHSVLAVSNAVLEDYQTHIGKQQASYMLKNYIEDKYFQQDAGARIFSKGMQLKFIAVGNIKKIKNYTYLVEAFSQLKELPVTLDIYGGGSEKDMLELQQAIDKSVAPVCLKGAVNNIETILPLYDLYVTSSLFEGFGLAVVEAMAMGLPVLLSDLPVLHEVTENNALFFDLSQVASFVDQVKAIVAGQYQLEALSESGMRIAGKYRKKAYLEKLLALYESLSLKQHK